MLTAIPADFGQGGANLAPDGAAGSPSLRDVLEEHRSAIAALEGGTDGANDELAVRFATTASINLATTALTAIDGVTPVAGDLALVKDQGTASQNGLYVVSAGAWTRLLDGNGDDIRVEGMLVVVAEGTTNKSKPFALESNLTTWNAAVTATLSSATPSPVAAAGAAGSSGNASKADHAHADPMRAAAGTNLTDTSTQSINIAAGNWRRLPTLSQNGVLTLLTTGTPVAGDQIEITRTDESAFTYTVVDGGSGTPTLCVLPALKKASAKFQWNGTNWLLRSIGVN